MAMKDKSVSVVLPSPMVLFLRLVQHLCLALSLAFFAGTAALLAALLAGRKIGLSATVEMRLEMIVSTGFSVGILVGYLGILILLVRAGTSSSMLPPPHLPEEEIS